MSTQTVSLFHRRWTRILAGLLALIAAAGVGVALAPPKDLRPKELRAGVSPQAASEGRRLLGALAARYGGVERWRALGATQIEYTDEWHDKMARWAISPFQDGERYRMTYQHGVENARLEYLAGPRSGEIWGIQQWETYKLRDGKPVFAPNKDIKFWLPTNQYFFEMPFRVTEASVVAHAGQREVGGKVYDLVYITWGSAEPQPKVDQYLLWISREGTTLDYAEFTVRDAFKFAVGCVHYQDLREVDGLIVPHRIRLADCPGKPGLVHEQIVVGLRHPQGLPASELVPDPTRGAQKY